MKKFKLGLIVLLTINLILSIVCIDLATTAHAPDKVIGYHVLSTVAWVALIANLMIELWYPE